MVLKELESAKATSDNCHHNSSIISSRQWEDRCLLAPLRAAIVARLVYGRPNRMAFFDTGPTSVATRTMGLVALQAAHR
jgi:hypothetical protein